MGSNNRTGIVKLTGIMTITKPNGKTYTYLRRRGFPLVQLPDLPHDHPMFLEAYVAARRKAPPAKTRGTPGSMNATITSCIASDRYKGVSKGYREILRRHLDAMRVSYGDLKIRDVLPQHIASDIRKARASDHRRKAWRFLCAFAYDADLLPMDPSEGVKAPKRPKTDGHPPWFEADIAAFRARWPIDTAPRRAMELIYWTGARISDAVKLGPGMIDNRGVLTYRQTKTGDLAHAPWWCALPQYALDMATDRELMIAAIEYGKGHMTFLATATGTTRSSKALGTMIREAAKEANIQKSAHGLRKSRAIEIAENGGTPHQIAAWTGHTTLQEVERYTRKADRRRAVMGTEQDQNGANYPGQMCKPLN